MLKKKKKKKGICEALSMYPISLHLIIKGGIKVATLSCPCFVFILTLSWKRENEMGLPSNGTSHIY